jgi:ribosomal protein L20
MTDREHLAEADRLIADCRDRIARQRKIIAKASALPQRSGNKSDTRQKWISTVAAKAGQPKEPSKALIDVTSQARAFCM